MKLGGHFGVSHMMILSSTKSNNYIRFVKSPKGPTLVFKIL